MIPPRGAAIHPETHVSGALPADAFVINIDSKMGFGSVHPVQALPEHRRKSDIPAKLVVVTMTSNGFTIADRNDAGMLDVVGFAAALQVIRDFIAAEELSLSLIHAGEEDRNGENCQGVVRLPCPITPRRVIGLPIAQSRNRAISATYVRNAAICGGVMVMNGRARLIRAIAPSNVSPSAMR